MGYEVNRVSRTRILGAQPCASKEMSSSESEELSSELSVASTAAIQPE